MLKRTYEATENVMPGLAFVKLITFAPYYKNSGID